MFCSKCGDKVEQNERYCNHCGNFVGKVDKNINDELKIESADNDYNKPVIISSEDYNYSQDNKPSISNNIDYNQVNYNNSNNDTGNNIYNNDLSVSNNIDYNQMNYNNSNNDNKTNNLKMLFIGVGFGIGCLIICFFIFNAKSNFYFSSNGYDDDNIVTESNGAKSNRGKYETVIITDNTYSGLKISNDKDAYDIISKDSTDQKVNCPKEIKAIEEEIITKYGVTAVNLCEMDISFAKEVSNVFKKVYNEYPNVRGYLTNLTLINAPIQQNYIAAFMPVFMFAESNSSTGYPVVIKTQVLLNTSYFLNKNKLENSVKDGSATGHFPPNATIYSPVAHELGHYLSFLALMRHNNLDSILLYDSSISTAFYKVYESFAKGDFSLLMIEEAYEKCKKEKNIKLSLDEWRATISAYAVAKDNSGNYIYDETIAEAFHDVYLNGNKAKDASKYVVAVLKKKLGG